MRVFVVSSLLLAIHCHEGICKKDRSSKNSKRGIFDDFGGSHESYGGNSIAVSNENGNGNGQYGGGYGGSYRDSYGAPVGGGGGRSVPNSIIHHSSVAIPQPYPFTIPKRVPAALPPPGHVQAPRPIQIPVPVRQHIDVPQRPYPVPVPVRASAVPHPVYVPQPQPQYHAPQQGPPRVPKTIFHDHYPVSHQPIHYEGGYESGYDAGYQGHYGSGYGQEGASYSTSVFHHDPHGHSGHHYPGGATSYSSVYKQ